MKKSLLITAALITALASAFTLTACKSTSTSSASYSLSYTDENGNTVEKSDGVSVNSEVGIDAQNGVTSNVSVSSGAPEAETDEAIDETIVEDFDSNDVDEADVTDDFDETDPDDVEADADTDDSEGVNYNFNFSSSSEKEMNLDLSGNNNAEAERAQVDPERVDALAEKYPYTFVGEDEDGITYFLLFDTANIDNAVMLYLFAGGETSTYAEGEVTFEDGVYTIHDDEEDMAVGFHIEAEHEDTDSIDIMFEGTDEVIPMSFYEPKSVIEEVLYILDTTNVVPLKDVSAA